MALVNLDVFGDDFHSTRSSDFFMLERKKEPEGMIVSTVISHKRPLDVEDEEQVSMKSNIATKRIASCAGSRSPLAHDVSSLFRDSWMDHVERPIPFNTRSLRFDRPSQLREAMTSMGWPNMVMARICEFGYDSRAIINIFVNLPPYLKSITLRALHAIEILYVEKQKSLPPIDVLSNQEDASSGGMEVERVFFEHETSVGFVKHHLDPKTGKRADIYVSQGWSSSIGIHVEEILSRIANRELPLLSTEFAYFSYVMYSIWSFATNPTKTFSMYARSRKLGANSEGECCIVHLIQKQDLDWTGRSRSMKSYVVTLDKHQFEDAMKSGNEASKFSRLSLNGRSYDELMRSFETDLFADETILGMQKTVEGETRLRAYAKELETMYTPIIKIAQTILAKNQSHNVI